MLHSVRSSGKADGELPTTCRYTCRTASALVDKNFEKHVIICSPGVKHVWELKEVISSNYCNMR
jgi:hypothetical protein